MGLFYDDYEEKWAGAVSRPTKVGRAKGGEERRYSVVATGSCFLQIVDKGDG